jgi:hypothetical protein
MLKKYRFSARSASSIALSVSMSFGREARSKPAFRRRQAMDYYYVLKRWNAFSCFLNDGRHGDRFARSRR